MPGPLSTISSSFSIPEVPSHAQQALSFKEAFLTYDAAKKIATLADLVTIMYETERLTVVQNFLKCLPKLVSFRIKSMGMEAALAEEEDKLYIESCEEVKSLIASV